MAYLPNSPHARDVAFHFHPTTNARKHEEVGPLLIGRGSGIHIYDDDGKQYIEGVAGLWSVAVGFGEERLVKAAADQMRKLSYYHTFNHKSHSPAINLAERLVNMAPGKMSKVFFANSGSEANDTAIKLVWYYNNARGRPEKKKIVSRQRAYHGATIASGSLTGLPWNQRDFDLPIANILHTSCPHHYRNALAGESEQAFATRMARELEDLILREGPETVAAFIGEPLMAAGGVIVPPATYWDRIQAVCRKYDVLVIADEVITGFGRLGKMFGCEYFNIVPDMLVVSKQLTSSYVPLSALLFSEEIYQVVADNSNKIGTFGHGFTASGHPVALAVAMENLDIIEERDLVGHVATISPDLLAGLHSFASHPLVGEVRGAGLVGAVELVADKQTKAGFENPGSVGRYLFARAHEEGLIIRPIGEIIAFCPPLITTEAQIKDMHARFARALDRTYEWVQSEPTKLKADA